MHLKNFNVFALLTIAVLPLSPAQAVPVYCEYQPYWPGCPKFCETHPEDWECKKPNGVQRLLETAQFHSLPFTTSL